MALIKLRGAKGKIKILEIGLQIKNKIAGFSLIEVLTALTIFAIVIPSIYLGTKTALQVIEKDKQRQIIITLDNYVSLLKTQQNSFSQSHSSEILANDHYYDLTLNFSPTPVARVHRAEALVTHKSNGRQALPLQRYFFYD
jgi:prepilin-type N-terminal cleavage/methylation domain-containing protein